MIAFIAGFIAGALVAGGLGLYGTAVYCVARNYRDRITEERHDAVR